jgi:pimeloyl-ACP methyl ester carboxylesterase
MMGEGDSLSAHPELLDLMVASDEDRIAGRTNANEARAIISPLALVTRAGFRRARVGDAELRGLGVPTMLIWGDRDPLGDVTVAQAIVDRLPEGELAVVPAGHGPWLGRPAETAGIVTDFLHRGS